MMSFLEFYGICLVVLSSIYILPQTIKMIRTKQVRDVSKTFLWYNLVVHALWIPYNVIVFRPDTMPYLLNNIIRTVLVGLTVICFYVYYKNGKTIKCKKVSKK